MIGTYLDNLFYGLQISDFISLDLDNTLTLQAPSLRSMSSPSDGVILIQSVYLGTALH